MSEKRPDYLSDALEMAGIDLDAPKQIVQEISGFTPLFDVVVQQYKDETRAAVHGAMWRYCQMEDGVCKASLSTIGDLLGISPATVMRHAEELCKDGYFLDLTPDLKNRPHVYADTGKVVMKSKIHVSQRNTGISQRNVGISESQLSKDIKKESENNTPKGDMVDFEISKLKATSIRQAFKKWPFNVNWETKSAREFMEWAHAENVTPDQVERAAEVWKTDKRFNWQHPSLKLIFEKWPLLMEAARPEKSESRTSLLRTL